MIFIYTREFCPNCEEVKDVLKSRDLKFEEKDVDYFKNKAKIVVRGFKELPIINIKDEWKEFDNIDSIIEFIGFKNDN
jgi:glutaredoxin